MDTKKPLGAKPFLLGQSPDELASYMQNNIGQIYQIYVDNVNANLSIFEFQFLGDSLKRIIAKAIFQNNAAFIHSGMSENTKKKRRIQIRKLVSDLLLVSRRQVHKWI